VTPEERQGLVAQVQETMDASPDDAERYVALLEEFIGTTDEVLRLTSAELHKLIAEHLDEFFPSI
jgi:hypothetical protein